MAAALEVFLLVDHQLTGEEEEEEFRVMQIKSAGVSTCVCSHRERTDARLLLLGRRFLVFCGHSDRIGKVETEKRN